MDKRDRPLLPIYTIDTETDPFLYKREPRVFCIGLYTGSAYHWTWGERCVSQMRQVLASQPRGIVYAHNGGKFDMYTAGDEGERIVDWVHHGQPVNIINGRIVKSAIGPNIHGEYHELRDSMSIMPFGLAKYKKDEIDYKLFERNVRERHKQTIIKYLKGDCVYLHELVSDFRDRFGDNLTIGGTAMKELRKLHQFDELDEDDDAELRGKFYFGGRVEYFERGILKPRKGKTFKVYDINQAYLHAMRDFDHPISAPRSMRSNEITKQTFFLSVYGRNHGAFATRTDTGNSYTDNRGLFHTTIHEYRAAIDTGKFEVEDIHECIDFDTFGRFNKFVDRFHGLRKDAQLSGDERGAIFYKFVGNSAYGKFAQDPGRYKDYILSDSKANFHADGYEPCELVEYAGYIMWERKAEYGRRFNVATGASITGACRSLIIRGLKKATRPVYCDTDCIVCEQLNGVVMDDTKLGAWKLEKSGRMMAIAGKKMYALFDGVDARSKCVKIASKGVQIPAGDIVRAAKGETVDFFKDAPTYSAKSGKVTFLHRSIKMT
jgi:hypothetical protein